MIKSVKLANVQQKTCSKCDRWLSVDEFYKSRKSKRKDGLDCWCKDCRRESLRRYYKDNPTYTRDRRKKNADKALASERAYRESHKDELRTRGRERYRRDPERHLAIFRDWLRRNPEYMPKYREENREARSDYNRRYRMEHIEARREYNRRYKAEHPEANQRSGRKRRVLILARTRDIVSLGEILSKDGAACYLCGKVTSKELPKGHPDKTTLDHVVPLTKGGAHDEGNIRVACHDCNTRKGNKTAEEFKEVLKRDQKTYA